MGKRKSSYNERWNIARVLTLIGGVLTLIGYGFALFSAIVDLDVAGILFSLLCIIMAIVVLIQVRLVKSKKLDIPLNWWLLLIFVVIQALVAQMIGSFVGLFTTADLFGFIGLGLLLEVIAVILLLINEM